jgi:hypothetical protein
MTLHDHERKQKSAGRTVAELISSFYSCEQEEKKVERTWKQAIVT